MVVKNLFFFFFKERKREEERKQEEQRIQEENRYLLLFPAGLEPFAGTRNRRKYDETPLKRLCHERDYTHSAL